MTRRYWLVADDYGISPAVSRGIRDLIAGGRLSGTGCMTLFPEWQIEAQRLKTVANIDKTAIGQHLTLTDFPGLTGFCLAGSDRMPGLKDLIAAVTASRRHDAAIKAELTAQHQAFTRHWGSEPAYFDGHQHVHFLRPVRDWLQDYAASRPQKSLPWLRGAPSGHFASGLALKAKVAVVSLLARGFDKRMGALGYTVKGPLAGFYDWQDPASFEAALAGWQKRVPDNAVVMCHPGGIDAVLRARDSLIDARAVEFDLLMKSPPFALKGAGR